MNRARQIQRVLLYTFILNEAVAAAKIIWGYLTHSLGMMSDGFHSMFDGVSNLVGMVGIHISAKPPDKEHPYGHRKYETLFSILVGLMILETCYQILKHVYISIQDGQRPEVGVTSFTVMALTVGVNVFVMLYEKKRGKELNSEFLVADAMHTKSNLLASAAVVVGLALTKAGLDKADALSGVVLAVFILKIGIEIIKEASDVLVDRSSLNTGAIEAVCCADSDVKGCHAIRSRGSEGNISLDLHIQLDPGMTLEEAHRITHRVVRSIKQAFPSIVDIVVHTEPAGSPNRKRRGPKP